MVQITTTMIVLFLLTGPAIASSFSLDDEMENLALREFSNELVARKIHIHLPKVHLPHIDGKKILDGLKKYGPKIGKAIFKIAKMILREDVEDQILAARDIDEAQDLYELLARSPKGSLKKLLKTVKKMKKYVKAGAKLAQSLRGAVGESPVDFVSRNANGDWEYELVERALEYPEITARHLYFHLAVLERGLTEVLYEGRDSEAMYEEREDWEVPYSRQYAQTVYFGRDYTDLDLEALD